MADFLPAFEKMIINEGGYVLHTVKGDNGGQTYAGIARNFHSDWEGWKLIDKGDLDNIELTSLVRDFYKQKFWDRIKGDSIEHQEVAESLFDFSVNTGVRTASKLAQITVGATPDGVVGPNTIGKINNFDPASFVLSYSLAKLSRYANICNRDRSQTKFLLGWVNRILKGLQ